MGTVNVDKYCGSGLYLNRCPNCSGRVGLEVDWPRITLLCSRCPFTLTGAPGLRPTPDSPYNLLQETTREDPWQFFSGVLLTAHADPVNARVTHSRLMRAAPTPEAFLKMRAEAIRLMVRSLGNGDLRAMRLQELAGWLYSTIRPCDWERFQTVYDVTEREGLGLYALESWVVFVLRLRPTLEAVENAAIRNYLYWLDQNVNIKDQDLATEAPFQGPVEEFED